LHTVLSRFNQFFESAPERCLPWRWPILFLFVVVTVVMLYGIGKRFTMDMSLESWFKDGDPAKVSLDEFRQQFGSDDGIYLIYRAKDGDVFSAKSLKVLQALHIELDNARVGILAEDKTESEDKTANEGTQNSDIEQAKLLTRIERIDSLYNARYQLADGDTLISKKLLANQFPETSSEREQTRQLALSQENFELMYYSKSFQYGGIRLKTDFGVVPVATESNDDEVEAGLLNADAFDMEGELLVDSSLQVKNIEFQDMQMEEYLNFMGALRALTGKQAYQHFDFYFTGNAALMEFAMNNMKQASGLLGLMVLIIVGLLWFLFRSSSAVTWPMLVIICSALWSVGLMCWFGVTLSLMVSFSTMLIIAVGVADCVHVLSAYVYYRREGQAHRAAMRRAYRKTGMPIFLTTITTMAGMSALMISDIPQIRVFGFHSALGVAMALLFTLFLLPVLLDIWHPFNRKAAERALRRKQKSWLQPLLDRIPRFVDRRAKHIVVVYFVFFGLLLFGASQVRVDSNLVELTKKSSEIRVTYDLVDKHMMGGQNIEFMFDLGQADALKNPNVLKVIDELQTHLETTYSDFVLKTFSLADFVKDTNKVMHEGLASFERIPDDQRLTAQLLYLFDNANPEDRRNLVSDDYSKSHIVLQLRNAGSYEYTDFFTRINADLERAFEPLREHYPMLELNVTGSLALMMKLVDHISWTQIKSFSFALLIITGMMMLTLGSVQAGLIAMVPNLLPAFFTFGVMGLLGVSLDTDTLIIAPLIIGIAVDDTIHFVAHYRDAWFESGDVDKALTSTIKEVGQAVTFTTLILGIGFSTLAFSDYLGHAKTGIFGSTAIFIALSSDLLLLPALIKWLKPDFGRNRHIAKMALETTCKQN